jgi:predicted amidohydrolase
VAAAQYPISFFSDFSEFEQKAERWVSSAGASYLLFPEYGSMELASLLPEEKRNNLRTLARELVPESARYISVFKRLAEKYKCYIIAPSLPVFDPRTETTTNRAYVFSPSGQVEYQDKLFMARFEAEQWGVLPGPKEVKIFETPELSFAVSICFDVEFAFPAILAAHEGAQVLFAPSCTDTLKGANRVHIGARARALENQMFVAVSQTIGQASWSEAVDVNEGFAAVYAPPDVGFTDDGIISSGQLNEETWVSAELRLSHLEKVRQQGAVFNFQHHAELLRSQKLAISIRKVRI